MASIIAVTAALMGPDKPAHLDTTVDRSGADAEGRERALLDVTKSGPGLYLHDEKGMPALPTQKGHMPCTCYLCRPSHTCPRSGRKTGATCHAVAA